MQSDTKADHRLELRRSSGSEPTSPTDFQNDSDIRLRALEPIKTSPNRQSQTDSNAIVVRDGSFGWKSAELPVLRNINVSICQAQLTMVIGPVACGKSTLLKAFLGETPSTQGFVYVSSREVAFCDQTPWLKNESIQRNILGFSGFDSPWYSAVVHACNLEEDLATFPMSDQSLIGSKGTFLSETKLTKEY